MIIIVIFLFHCSNTAKKLFFNSRNQSYQTPILQKNKQLQIPNSVHAHAWVCHCGTDSCFHFRNPNSTFLPYMWRSIFVEGFASVKPVVAVTIDYQLVYHEPGWLRWYICPGAEYRWKGMECSRHKTIIYVYMLTNSQTRCICTNLNECNK